MIPIMFGVSLLVFLLLNVFGGDPALRYAGRHATAEMVQNIRLELGLNQPVHIQYVNFLKQIVTFDYGRSWATKQEISTMLKEGMSASMSLTVPAFFISLLFSIALAMATSFYRGSLFDRGVVIMCLAFMSISSLVYILALQYFFAYDLGLFPISGWDPSWTGRWAYLVLPWIIIFVLSLGPDILIYRTVIQDEAYQDYARTARAKGLSTAMVYGKHILKNSMIPIITMVVVQMPFLIAGAVLIENFFGIPGLGGTTLKAISDSDFPVIKAMTIVISIAYMFFNLLADLLYAWVDPRVRLG